MSERRVIFSAPEPEIKRRATGREPPCPPDNRKRVTPSHTTLLNIDDINGLGRNRLVPFYLMASFSYYELNDVFMDDDGYDRLCRRLQEEWPQISHPHKSLVKLDSLDATTGYNLDFKELPSIIKVATVMLLDQRNLKNIRELIRTRGRTALV